MATSIEEPEPVVAAAFPVEPAATAAPRSNVLAKIAFGLACAVVVLMGSYSLILATHQDELGPLLDQGQSFSDGMQAFHEYAAAHGGVLPPWLMAMSLLSLTAGVVWVAALVCGIVAVCRPVDRSWAVAALVITGIAPLFFCCGGVASAMSG